jgi:uncharacterized membrane-anchored protein
MNYVAFVLFFFVSFLHSQDQIPPELERPLDWQNAGTYKLPRSNAMLSIPEGRCVVLGSEADRAATMMGNLPDENIETITCADQEIFPGFVFFSYFNTGYVSLDSWKDVDPKQILQSFQEDSEIRNKQRKEKGISPLHIIGWAQEPTLDRQSNTIRWATELKEDGCDEPIINATALKLGRHGYEHLVLVIGKSLYQKHSNELDMLLSGFNFEVGSRYEDYSIGDRIADIDIASLIGASVGGTVITGIIVFVKKFIGIILVAASALFYKLKDLFKKKKEDPVKEV